MAKILKKIFIPVFLAFTLCIGVVYAATSGDLDFTGIAYVVNSAGGALPVYPITEGGYYLQAGGDMDESGWRIGGEAWEGNILTAELIKPPSLNPENNGYLIAFSFLNPTPVPWYGGTAGVLTGAAVSADGAEIIAAGGKHNFAWSGFADSPAPALTVCLSNSVIAMPSDELRPFDDADYPGQSASVTLSIKASMAATDITRVSFYVYYRIGDARAGELGALIFDIAMLPFHIAGE